ncbi:MAG: hypothetical protein M3014_02730 [Chloroflexota bacterium]|nr:hypothetical protein [Chloroflexota bacterium]
MYKKDAYPYPLPISRALEAAEKICVDDGSSQCHASVLRVADALTYYMGSVAVAHYSQAYYTGQIEVDPTLNRSLRSLRRLLPGQWLGWIARGLQAAPAGAVPGLADWYAQVIPGAAPAYEELRRLMVERLSYTGEYGPRQSVSPRLLLEIIDQYRIRRARSEPGSEDAELDTAVSGVLLPGLREVIEAASFLVNYPLYAPQQRQLIMGLKAATPMPPMSSPGDADATLLLYPPGEEPDYTKRPNLQVERLPLFPLDPLLVYINCVQCGKYRVAALQGVSNDRPTYLGLDPDCGHSIEL